MNFVLSLERDTSMNKQYKIIKLSKGNGKQRLIYAPQKAYKHKLQSFLLELQQKCHVADKEGYAHAFLRGRSIVTCAKKHTGYEYTLSLDIENFFDHIRLEMVESYLTDEQKRLCFIDGIARQGLPTSPLIANLAMVAVDTQIMDSFSEMGIHLAYSRYGDDMFFSFNDEALSSKIEFITAGVLAKYALYLNVDKRKLQKSSAGRRQILGIGVGARALYPSRKLKRKIRAARHQKRDDVAKGLLSFASNQTPKPFYTDRDLLAKYIFEEDALDIANDFFLSEMIVFDSFVEAVESNFEDMTLKHNSDHAQWELQKAAFLTQREAFYQQQKVQNSKTKVDVTKLLEAEQEREETQERQPAQQPKKSKPSVKAPSRQTSRKPTPSKENNIDLDAINEIDKEHRASYQKESRERYESHKKVQHVQEVQQERKKGLNKIFIASILPIVILIGMMSYYFSAKEVVIKDTYPLFIETVPFGAKIQIMNIKPKYTIGIELKPGNYDIRISKKGYRTKRFWIKMEHEPISIKRELIKIKKRKVY